MNADTKQLTTEEAAQSLGVTPSRVRQMIRAGQLPATRFGKSHMIYERDLDAVRDRPVGRPPAIAKPAAQPAKRRGRKAA